MINSVFALGFESDKFNWSDLSPLSIEQKVFDQNAKENVNKAIDANFDILGIYFGHDIVKASSLIGAFYNIDAASLLGKSSAGNDQKWISDATNLRDLLRAGKTSKQGTHIAEIMYMGRDPFSHKVVINVGTNQNVVLGQAAIDAAGLLGQVTRVFPYSSEVTLLTDQDLSIPIQIERNGLRAIAFGSGKSGMVDVPYLPANVDIKQGDKLVTSGIDGVYPVGLAVATVESVKSSSSSPFAKIAAKPLAGIQNHRLILLIDMPAKNAVMEEIKKTVAADKAQQKKSMSTVEKKP